MPNRVDDDESVRYNSGFSATNRYLASLVPLLALLLMACAARSGSGAVMVDFEAERIVIEEASPDGPLWITFDWEAREHEARYSGKGAARVEPPTMARLDLFGPRGESYLSAAVVDEEVRLPDAMDTRMVPPPALLWGALGIFHPPVRSELTTSVREGERLRLEYRAEGERWHYEFDDGRLRRVEWQGEGSNRKTVELKGEGAARLPKEATYRDWGAFTELKIRVDEVEEVDSFPPEIWHPNVD